MADDEFTKVPVRLLGLGFAVGEAAKYRFSQNITDLCHTVTVGFVWVHVIHTGITTKLLPPILGTVLFEGICSCIIPPVVNYHLCKFVAKQVWAVDGIPLVVKKWAPFVAGLLTLPFFVAVVDPFVQELIVTNILPAVGG